MPQGLFYVNGLDTGLYNPVGFGHNLDDVFWFEQWFSIYLILTPSNLLENPICFLTNTPIVQTTIIELQGKPQN